MGILGGWRKQLLLVATLVIIVFFIVWGISIKRSTVRFINEEDTEKDNLEMHDKLVEQFDLRNSREYKSWKHTSDTSFKSLYNGNQLSDVLQQRPKMVVLWAGYAFAKDYATPRGHMYAIEDLHKSLRTGAPMSPDAGPQQASCWACKSADVPRLIGTLGSDTFYKKKWAAWGSEVVNPVACADCHLPEDMTLHIPRPFLIEAVQQMGTDMEDVTVQQMRSLVCAQCHAEYYFKGENKEPALPWDRGLAVEDMEAFYDQIGFSDFTHKLSRTPIIKAQHPDYELAQMGIHAQRGVSCGECHMSYVGVDGLKYNNHHIQSPLAMINRTCQVCHRESEETLLANVYDRQNKVMETRARLEDELTKVHIEAAFAWNIGATEKQMGGVLKLIRKAQWRWDFCIASHGASFHAPQEVQRILGEGLDKALQARMSLMKVLASLGYNKEVPMPDLSTKEKAQQYIGLDMAAERAAKDEFLKTVIPEWMKEARENKRLIDD